MKHMTKAATLACDAVILDLEDAVAPAAKESARAAIGSVLRDVDFGTKTVVVRVNALDTPWGRGDVAAVMEWPRVDAVALPKVQGPDDVEKLGVTMRRAGMSSSSLPVWAFVETAKGVLAAHNTASSSDLVQALVVGSNDLARDLNARVDRFPGALDASKGAILLAARAAGTVCLDGVPRQVRPSTEDLIAECERARDMGFDGKTLIHPVTIEEANKAFSPSHEEIEEAERIVRAVAEAGDSGVCVVDGKLIEELHVDQARRVLAQHAAIEASRG